MNRGITLAIVAIMIVAILGVLAFLINITAALIRLQEFHNMADLGAAAGGRVVAEAIAERATQNVNEELTARRQRVYKSTGYLVPANPDDWRMPEKFITPGQRAYFENNDIYNNVTREVNKYIFYNKPNVFLHPNIAVEFPFNESANRMMANYCSDPINKIVTVKVVLKANEVFPLARLADWLANQDHFNLSVVGLYEIKICP